MPPEIFSSIPTIKSAFLLLFLCQLDNSVKNFPCVPSRKWVVFSVVFLVLFLASETSREG